MGDVKMTNIPSMNVNRIIDTLSDAYSTIINEGQMLKLLPSVMLWGPPGVGKSQAIRQLAKRITSQTGKETYLTDVRLLLFNPIDLRGIPTANADKTLAVWLKPQIFQMNDSSDVVNILFLDEISAAPQSVQAAAYQITLDRVVGEHRLPDNCIVIAAGNRTTDKSVAFKMPKALANRLLHIEVEGSFKAWKEWAIRSGINPKVVGFLSFRQQYLMKFDASSEDLAFATPRSWEMVSNLMNHVSDDVDEIGKGCRCKETDSATLLAGFQRNGRCQMEFINPETGESMIGYIYKGNLAAEESENVEIQEEELSKVTEIPETIPDMTEGQVASTE